MISFEISAKKLEVVAGAAAVVLAGLALGVLSGRAEKFDMAVLFFLKGARFPVFNELFLILTYLGSVQFISVATVCTGAILFIKKRFGNMYLLAGTVFGNAALVLLLKDLIERARPAAALAVYSETSYSFPSGHTSAAVAFYGVLAYILAQSYADTAKRANILFGWIFFMAMIGFSRMYLGVHYASDVMGGYALGFLCLSMGIILFEKFTKE